LRKDAYFQVWEALYRWRAKKDSQRNDSGTALKSPDFPLPLRWKKK